MVVAASTGAAVDVRLRAVTTTSSCAPQANRGEVLADRRAWPIAMRAASPPFGSESYTKYLCSERRRGKVRGAEGVERGQLEHGLQQDIEHAARVQEWEEERRRIA